jgi:hypothetical protein
MSGCPHTHEWDQYTERHNVGGRILLKALLKGGRGLDVVMHDIRHAADAELMQHAPAAPTSGGSFATPESQNAWVLHKRKETKAQCGREK